MKRFSFLAVAATAIITLSACGTENSGNAENNEKATETASVEANEEEKAESDTTKNEEQTDKETASEAEDKEEAEDSATTEEAVTENEEENPDSADTASEDTSPENEAAEKNTSEDTANSEEEAVEESASEDTTNSEEEAPSGPARWSHGAVVINAIPDPQLYIWGGLTGALTTGKKPSGTYMNDMRLYNLNNQSWQELPFQKKLGKQ